MKITMKGDQGSAGVWVIVTVETGANNFAGQASVDKTKQIEGQALAIIGSSFFNSIAVPMKFWRVK